MLGWGFGSYDRVKSSADFPYVPGLPGNIYLYARENTSHDTYLTILVELGLVGLLLLLGPFVVIVARALARARSIAADRWIVAAACGSLIVVVLNGMTLDYRFFSFVPALSFVMLAILRRVTSESGPAGRRRRIRRERNLWRWKRNSTEAVPTALHRFALAPSVTRRLFGTHQVFSAPNAKPCTDDRMEYRFLSLLRSASHTGTRTGSQNLH